MPPDLGAASPRISRPAWSRTLVPVIERIDFDGFHTRCLAFAMSGRAATEEVVHRGLSFEVQMLRLLAGRFPALAADHLQRAAITAARLSS